MRSHGRKSHVAHIAKIVVLDLCQIKQETSFNFADNDLSDRYKSTGFFPAPTFELKFGAFKARTIRNFTPLFAFKQYSQAFKFYLDKESEAGIISFKNLNKGFLKFTKKEKPKGGDIQTLVSKEILEEYSEQLKNLIIEIFNSEIPFTEKEV